MKILCLLSYSLMHNLIFRSLSGPRIVIKYLLNLSRVIDMALLEECIGKKLDNFYDLLLKIILLFCGVKSYSRNASIISKQTSFSVHHVCLVS